MIVVWRCRVCRGVGHVEGHVEAPPDATDLADLDMRIAAAHAIVQPRCSGTARVVIASGPPRRGSSAGILTTGCQVETRRRGKPR